MKRHSDYRVTIQRRVDPIRWRWRNGKFDCFKITRKSSFSRYVGVPLLRRFIKPAPGVQIMHRSVHVLYIYVFVTNEFMRQVRVEIFSNYYNNNNIAEMAVFNVAGYLRGKAQMACNYCFPTRTTFKINSEFWKEGIFRWENRTSCLVGLKTHPTIVPWSGIELTTSRLHNFIMAKVSHALNHSAIETNLLQALL